MYFLRYLKAYPVFEAHQKLQVKLMTKKKTEREWVLTKKQQKWGKDFWQAENYEGFGYPVGFENTVYLVVL